jgi:hypothetical protein
VSLLDLNADVKPHLKIDRANDDTVLQAKLDAAEAFVSRQTNGSGGLGVTTATERITGGRTALPLSYTPIVSVTSVTDASGNTLVVANLDVDKEQGIINYSVLGGVLFPLLWYSVVYQTGYASVEAVPEEVKEAVRLMTQHFYETQRGPRRPVGGDEATSPNAYMRAMQILDDFNTSAGFA